MTDTQILPLGSENAPADWTLPKGATVTPKSIFAHFNGTAAAGSFIPTLTIFSDSGDTVANIKQDETITAGSAVDATWAPFLKGGGGTSVVSLDASSMEAATTSAVAIPSGVRTVFDFNTSSSHGPGFSFVQVTAPKRAIQNVDGGPWVATFYVEWEAFAGDRYIEIVPELPAGVELVNRRVRNRLDTSPNGDQMAVTCSGAVAGGTFIRCYVFQNSGVDRNINAAYLNAVSALDFTV